MPRAARKTYRRGDVVLARYPDSDQHTQRLRPALVIQADNLRTGIPQVIVAMVTTQLAYASHPSRVLVRELSREGQTAGLLFDSVVMTDNTTTIAESLILRVIGNLPMSKVDAALRHTLAL